MKEKIGVLVSSFDRGDLHKAASIIHGSQNEGIYLLSTATTEKPNMEMKSNEELQEQKGWKEVEWGE